MSLKQIQRNSICITLSLLQPLLRTVCMVYLDFVHSLFKNLTQPHPNPVNLSILASTFSRDSPNQSQQRPFYSSRNFNSFFFFFFHKFINYTSVNSYISRANVTCLRLFFFISYTYSCKSIFFVKKKIKNKECITQVKERVIKTFLPGCAKFKARRVYYCICILRYILF